jgi:myo-inositol 2-dehydrogenase/D-chiro-inositol 1-dehydrogenase
LLNPQIDTVIITTYPETHCQIAIAAMKAGKAVLCDKPVTGNLNDAVKLYKYVKEHNCKFAVGLNLPFYPSAIKIKELLTQKVIGNLLCIRSMCDVGAEFGKSVIMRKFAGQDEGLLLGKLTHDTDLIQYFADSYAEEVTGYSANFLWKRHGDNAGSHDTAVISGVMNNGVIFSQSLTSCGATYGRIVELFGSKGMIRADINSETILIHLAEEQPETLQLTPKIGSHRGGDKIMFSEFLDYVDSEGKVPLRAERILSSVMIPLAAMEQKTVYTGKWYRAQL